MRKKYPGAGTQGPALYAAEYYRISYYWPNTTPCKYFYIVFSSTNLPLLCLSNKLLVLVSPMGNPNLKGIIAGQIYDYATP